MTNIVYWTKYTNVWDEGFFSNFKYKGIWRTTLSFLGDNFYILPNWNKSNGEKQITNYILPWNPAFSLFSTLSLSLSLSLSVYPPPLGEFGQKIATP